MEDTHRPDATTQQGPETPIWEGSPSQWTNVLWFVSCVLVVPIPFAVYAWLRTRCTQYTLTSQRLRWSYGILNKHFDDLELYRVKDATVTQPFLQRLVGLGTVRLITSDATTPELRIPAISDPLAVLEAIRAQVESLRRSRGVREFDVV